MTHPLTRRARRLAQAIVDGGEGGRNGGVAKNLRNFWVRKELEPYVFVVTFTQRVAVEQPANYLSIVGRCLIIYEHIRLRNTEIGTSVRC